MRNLKKQSKNGTEGQSEIPSSLPIYAQLFSLKKSAIKIFLVFLFTFLNISGTNSRADFSNMEATIENKLTPEEMYVLGVKEKFTDNLVQEVENYIIKMAPESKLSPDYLVSKCLEYDMDITFVLAQALLESHFGTKGVAARTNSVWNVGTYDNGKILYTYSHPNESLEPYLKLVSDKYLINVTSKGDTIYKDLHHLVKDRGYKNFEGNRFASARGYENAMRKLLVQIGSETSINFYQDIMRLSENELIAYFVPPEDIKIDYSQLQAMR